MSKVNQFITFVKGNGRAPLKEDSPQLYRWFKYQREKYRNSLPIKADILAALESNGMDSYLFSRSYKEASSNIIGLLIKDLDESGHLPSDHAFYNFWYRKLSGYYEVYDTDLELLAAHGLNFLKKEKDAN